MASWQQWRLTAYWAVSTGSYPVYQGKRWFPFTWHLLDISVIPCVIFGPSSTRMILSEFSEGPPRAGAHTLSGEIEGTGLVPSGEGKAWGNLSRSLDYRLTEVPFNLNGYMKSTKHTKPHTAHLPTGVLQASAVSELEANSWKKVNLIISRKGRQSQGCSLPYLSVTRYFG